MGRKVLRKGQAPQAKHTALYDRVTKLQSEVLDRIRELKNKPPKGNLCQHLGQFGQNSDQYEQQKDYYDLYWRQYLMNQVGITQTRILQKETSEFQRKLNKIQTLLEQREEEMSPFQQKKEKQLSHHKCNGCGKVLKDTETLLLHQKIKHQEMGEDLSINQRNYSVEIFDSDLSDD